MDNNEKIARLAALISPDTADNDLLLYLLEQAEGIILNRRYPFGAPEGATLSPLHEQIQIRMALELFSKMGAEGQISHQENGVYRGYEAGDVSQSLLKLIVPVAGSVM